MKNLILAVLFLMVFTSCSKSQDSIPKVWSSVQYNYTAGPLPPPYHHSFDISVNSDGDSKLIYRLGYDNSKEPLVYTFMVSPADIKNLDEKVVCSKLLTGNVEAIPENKHPIGGSLNKVRIIIPNPNPDLDQPPRVIESPYFPTEDYKDGLQDLYDFIKTLVPVETWNDVSLKKEEYEKSFKK